MRFRSMRQYDLHSLIFGNFNCRDEITISSDEYCLADRASIA